MGPSDRVLDLFAVPGNVEPLPGGSGGSVLAGDLVLSPGRDEDVLGWLAPTLARMAVRLDERPDRSTRDLRIAMPVPARDGHWTAEGWGATRYEPGTVACHDPALLAAAGRLLHARLAVEVPHRPEGLGRRTDRWARAERAAFDETEVPGGAPAPAVALVRRLRAGLAGADLGTAQLVHADLAGNLLLDGYGAPVVIDVSPAWRPPAWAAAVARLDAVLWLDAPASWLETEGDPVRSDALRRAAVFRLLSDEDPDVATYERVLGAVLDLEATGGRG